MKALLISNEFYLVVNASFGRLALNTTTSTTTRLIGKLLIGYVDEAKSRRRTEKEQEEIRDGLGMPAPRPEKQNVVAIPSPFMTSLDESPYDDTDEIWEKDKTTS